MQNLLKFEKLHAAPKIHPKTKFLFNEKDLTIRSFW